MIARAKISAAVKHERTRDVVIFIAEHEDCSIKDIGLAFDIDRAVALRCIKSACDHYHCDITYTTERCEKGGVTYKYQFVGIGKGSLVCVDEEVEREYTVEQMNSVKSTRLSNSVIEILEVFDANNEYLTMQELAEMTGIAFTAFRVRVQCLENSIPGLYIHRIGPVHERKIKLVSLTQFKEMAEPKVEHKLPTGMSNSLLLSVFR